MARRSTTTKPAATPKDVLGKWDAERAPIDLRVRRAASSLAWYRRALRRDDLKLAMPQDVRAAVEALRGARGEAPRGARPRESGGGEVTESLQGQRRRARTAPAVVDFIRGGGWRIVSSRSGGGDDRCGLTAHRGVLHPDEWRWLDRGAVVADVERRLGFTVDELRLVYRQGRKSAAQRELRARVDARLLDVARIGGNMALLACVTGLHEHTVSHALARARTQTSAT
jgi:hypothetical protein